MTKKVKNIPHTAQHSNSQYKKFKMIETVTPQRQQQLNFANRTRILFLVEAVVHTAMFYFSH